MSKKWSELPAWVRAKIIKSKQGAVDFQPRDISTYSSKELGALSDAQFSAVQAFSGGQRDLKANSKSRRSVLDNLTDKAFDVLGSGGGGAGGRKKSPSTRAPKCGFSSKLK